MTESALASLQRTHQSVFSRLSTRSLLGVETTESQASQKSHESPSAQTSARTLPGLSPSTSLTSPKSPSHALHEFPPIPGLMEVKEHPNDVVSNTSDSVPATRRKGAPANWSSWSANKICWTQLPGVNCVEDRKLAAAVEGQSVRDQGVTETITTGGNSNSAGGRTNAEEGSSDPDSRSFKPSSLSSGVSSGPVQEGAEIHAENKNAMIGRGDEGMTESVNAELTRTGEGEVQRVASAKVAWGCDPEGAPEQVQQ